MRDTQRQAPPRPSRNGALGFLPKNRSRAHGATPNGGACAHRDDATAGPRWKRRALPHVDVRAGAPLMLAGGAAKVRPSKRLRQRIVMTVLSRRVVLAAALVALMAPAGGAANALDTVRLGKAVPNSFAFSTAEIGTDAGIWPQEGIALDVSAF